MFGRKKPDARQVARQGQKDIKASTRDLDRELMRLQREEQKLMNDTKIAARQNNQAACRSLAKQVVQCREA